LFLLKYSPSGSLLKQVTITDPILTGKKFSSKIAKDDSSNIYVQGRYLDNGIFNDLLMKISADGDFRWSNKLSNESLNCTAAGFIIQNGRLHAFSTEGSSNNVATGVPYLTFPGALYDHVWDTAGNRYQDQDQHFEQLPLNCIFTSVTPTSDDGCLLAGTTGFFGGDYVSPSKVILVKLSSGFTLEWTKQIETYVPSLGIDALELNGNYYVSGTALFADSVAFMMLLKTPVE